MIMITVRGRPSGGVITTGPIPATGAHRELLESIIADAQNLIRAAELELAGVCEDGQGHWIETDPLLLTARRLVRWVALRR